MQALRRQWNSELTIAFMVLATCGSAPFRIHADVLWDNDIFPDGSGEFDATNSPNYPQWDWRLAEDFQVPAGGWIFQDFHMRAVEHTGWTTSGITTITIFRADGTIEDGQVYANGAVTPIAGGPGSILTQITAPYTRTPTGEIIEWGPFNPLNIYQYDAVFPGVFIPEGSYYISWRDDAAAESGYSAWVMSTGGDHPNPLLASKWDHHALRSEPGGIENNNPWRVYGDEDVNWHLAFIIGGIVPGPALLGDLDDDGLVNLADVPHFVDALMGNPPANGSIIQSRADMNADLTWNGLDCSLFTGAVLP